MSFHYGIGIDQLKTQKRKTEKHIYIYTLFNDTYMYCTCRPTPNEVLDGSDW